MGRQPPDTDPRPIWPVQQPERAPAPPPVPASVQTAPRPEPPEDDRTLTLSVAKAPPGVLIGAALFVVINLALLGLYLWSQGGQHVHLRLEARGNQFAAYLDGRLQVSSTVPNAPPEGGIQLTLEDTENLPSMPEPRGFDRVVVTDLTTGQVLFEDDFSDGPSAQWEDMSGAVSSRSGVLRSDGPALLVLSGQPWRDYAVDLFLVNTKSATVSARVATPGTGVEYAARPFRHYDTTLNLFEGGQLVEGELGLPAEAMRSETAKGMVAMLLRPYPLVFLFLVGAFLAVLVLSWVGSLAGNVSLPPAPRDVPWIAVGWIAAFAFGVTLYLNYSFNSHIPHVPDEVAYLFQAKIFASGRLAAPTPPVQEVFNYFNPPFIIESDGNWSSVYTFGHSAVLSIGAAVGAVWIIPSLVGAGTVVLLFAIGRRLYSTRVGLLAAGMLATSPFFLMSSSNFMSHNTVAFLLLASFFLILIGERRPLIYGGLAGLAFGLMFNTRPLESIALMPAFALLLAARLVPPDGRWPAARQIAAFAAGGLVMLGAYIVYNLGTTGEAFTSTLQQGNEEGKLIAFGGEHSVSLGVQNEHIQLLFLVLVLHGWPVFVGLGAVLLPIVLASRNAWDWFLLVSALSIMVAYLFFRGHGIMHGPRYWYPAAPLLILFAARGADHAADLLSRAAAYVRQRLTGNGAPHGWAGVVVVYAFVVALMAVSVNGWLLGREQWWEDEFVPARAEELKGFNGANDGLVRLLEESDLSNALVLLENCPRWQCYGTVFWQNSPDLDGDVVIARDLPEHRAELLERYPGRRVYFASYDGPLLGPYGGGLIAPDQPVSDADKDAAPLATSLPRPTAVATPTPDVGDTLARDIERRDDLAFVAELLATYREQNGAYPVSTGLQSLCRFQELDAGCALLSLADPLPRDPLNDGDYWYDSDGNSFILYAVLEAAVEEGACGDNPPFSEEQRDRLFCVRSPP